MFCDKFKSYTGRVFLHSGTHDLLFVIKCINGLHKLPLDKLDCNKIHTFLTPATTRSSPVSADAKLWHEKIRHIRANRYDQLSKLLTTIPSFHSGNSCRILTRRKHHRYLGSTYSYDKRRAIRGKLPPGLTHGQSPMSTFSKTKADFA